MCPSATHASPWKFVSQISPLFFPLVKYKVGNGSLVRLWEDVWKGATPLWLCSHVFTNFHIARGSSFSFLLEYGKISELSSAYCRHPLEWEMRRYFSLISVLESVTLTHADYLRKWISEARGLSRVSPFWTTLVCQSGPVFSSYQSCLEGKSISRGKRFCLLWGR